MSSADIRSIQDAFSDFECGDTSVWDSALGLSVQFGFTASELAEKYEVFAYNKYASIPLLPLHVRSCGLQHGAGLGSGDTAPRVQAESSRARHGKALWLVCRISQERKVQRESPHGQCNFRCK
jgi:hypothetical protein